MNKSIKKIISLALCGVLLISGCKERTDTDFDAGFNDKKYEPIDTDDSETLIPVITTTTASETADVTTAPHITTTPVTTMVTTTLSPEDIYGGSVYTDENGEVLLALTDGSEYADNTADYDSYYKITNVSDKTVTELREKIVTFNEFADTESMTIEYPFSNNCVDIIKWYEGEPLFEYMDQYFDALTQMEYTFDNTLDPEEYCIVSVRFNNVSETTTEDDYSNFDITNSLQEDNKTVITTEKPLSDPSYSKFMPSNDIIAEAVDIMVKNKEVVIAVYPDGSYEAISDNEDTERFLLNIYMELLSERTYKKTYTNEYSTYEQYFADMIVILSEDELFRENFNEKGEPLKEIQCYLGMHFKFFGKNGEIDDKTIAETVIRWGFSLRTEENGPEYYITKAFEHNISSSFIITCNYDGGNTAVVEANDGMGEYVKEITLTF